MPRSVLQHIHKLITPDETFGKVKADCYGDSGKVCSHTSSHLQNPHKCTLSMVWSISSGWCYLGFLHSLKGALKHFNHTMVWLLKDIVSWISCFKSFSNSLTIREILHPMSGFFSTFPLACWKLHSGEPEGWAPPKNLASRQKKG